MAKFNVKDVVRILPEWCDCEADRTFLWVVVEVYENTNRCKAVQIMTEEQKRNRPFGCVTLFGFDMIEKVEVE